MNDTTFRTEIGAVVEQMNRVLAQAITDARVGD
jgi:hypothetical protein